MRRSLVALGVVALALFSGARESDACTVFRLKAQDGAMVIGRTMEFGFDVHSRIVVVPRGQAFTSPAPGEKTGLSWKNKYGYVAVDSFGRTDVIFDGMNEAGLAISALWFETDMKWPDFEPQDAGSAVANVVMGSWVLGNFEDVGDVRSELPKRKVFAYVFPQVGATATAHLIVYDRKGKSVVVEYDRGEVHVYDNPLDIMTNAPNFPYMVANLRNYIGVTPEQIKAPTFSGVQLLPTGHGSGMFGLPGDITPPSRFVRLAFLTHFAEQPNDAAGALNLAQHIVNTFDIVRGVSIDRDAAGKVTAIETTQWSSYRDQTNLDYYFRTYDNFNLRKVSFAKLDFKAPKIRFIPMPGDKEAVVDMTDRLR